MGTAKALFSPLRVSFAANSLRAEPQGENVFRIVLPSAVSALLPIQIFIG